MDKAEGYTFRRRDNGVVAIFHHGRLATTLRGNEADAFVEEGGKAPSQELMERVAGTGRGSEPSPSLRVARDQEHRGPLGR